MHRAADHAHHTVDAVLARDYPTVQAVILLFLGETTAFMSARWAIAGFLGGIACFLLALLCFLAETVIATRLLDFELLKR